MTEADPLNWDKQIPTLLMGYQATKQASTKKRSYSDSFGSHPLASDPIPATQPIVVKEPTFLTGSQEEGLLDFLNDAATFDNLPSLADLVIPEGDLELGSINSQDLFGDLEEPTVVSN
ncbi:hypothetical protein WJX79_005300 [Trebouxia sp. C0005]